MFRAKAKGIKGGVSRDGGDFDAGMIGGVAVITRGEALGHDAFVDKTMVDQVVSAINDVDGGVKSRFTHPDLSSDSLGKMLGRVKNARLADRGNKVIADLHFNPAAHNAPGGDLAGYVMDLAESDPTAFGTSISFSRDIGEEERFRADHTDKDGAFKSPDKKNEGNLQHWRVAEVHADDVVDEPGANPDGLFHRDAGFIEEMDSLASFALGVTDTEPALCELDVHPERVRDYVGRFLDAHNLELKEKSNMGAKTANPESATDDAFTIEDMQRERQAGRDEVIERIKTLSAQIDEPEFVMNGITRGDGDEEILSQWRKAKFEALKADNEKLQAENAELKKATQDRPADNQADPKFVQHRPSGNGESRDFLAVAKERAETDGCDLKVAMSRVASENPELHEQFKDDAVKLTAQRRL